MHVIPYLVIWYNPLGDILHCVFALPPHWKIRVRQGIYGDVRRYHNTEQWGKSLSGTMRRPTEMYLLCPRQFSLGCLWPCWNVCTSSMPEAQSLLDWTSITNVSIHQQMLCWLMSVCCQTPFCLFLLHHAVSETSWSRCYCTLYSHCNNVWLLQCC